MPNFTPHQRWFRALEQLCIDDSLTRDGYTVTRQENNLYSVQHGEYYIEFSDEREGTVAATLTSVATYCIGTRRNQACTRSRWRSRHRIEPRRSENRGAA